MTAAENEELNKRNQKQHTSFLEASTRTVEVVNIADRWDRRDCEGSVLSAYGNLSADREVCAFYCTVYHTVRVPDTVQITQQSI